MDEVRGEWLYLYRAVDKAGKTVDFFLSRRRDVNAAKAFLRKVMKGQRVPTKVTLDAYAASHRAVADLKENGELPKRVRVRQQQVLEQPDRARPSENQTAVAADVGAEELRNGQSGNRRDRTGGEDQEGAVQDGQAGRAHGHDARSLASRPGCLVGSLPIEMAKSSKAAGTFQFAPEPARLRRRHETEFKAR